MMGNYHGCLVKGRLLGKLTTVEPALSGHSFLQWKMAVKHHDW